MSRNLREKVSETKNTKESQEKPYDALSHLLQRQPCQTHGWFGIFPGPNCISGSMCSYMNDDSSTSSWNMLALPVKGWPRQIRPFRKAPARLLLISSRTLSRRTFSLFPSFLRGSLAFRKPAPSSFQSSSESSVSPPCSSSLRFRAATPVGAFLLAVPGRPQLPLHFGICECHAPCCAADFRDKGARDPMALPSILCLHVERADIKVASFQLRELGSACRL